MTGTTAPELRLSCDASAGGRLSSSTVTRMASADQNRALEQDADRHGNASWAQVRCVPDLAGSHEDGPKHVLAQCDNRDGGVSDHMPHRVRAMGLWRHSRSGAVVARLDAC